MRTEHVVWDGEALYERADPETGATILIALHSSRLGPSSGGTRMKTYPDLEAARRDARRLSEGMTYKWAAAGFPRGGGKAVLAVPAGLSAERRDGLLRRYGSFIQDHEIAALHLGRGRGRPVQRERRRCRAGIGDLPGNDVSLRRRAVVRHHPARAASTSAAARGTGGKGQTSAVMTTAKRTDWRMERGRYHL